MTDSSHKGDVSGNEFNAPAPFTTGPNSPITNHFYGAEPEGLQARRLKVIKQETCDWNIIPFRKKESEHRWKIHLENQSDTPFFDVEVTFTGGLPTRVAFMKRGVQFMNPKIGSPKIDVLRVGESADVLSALVKDHDTLFQYLPEVIFRDASGKRWKVDLNGELHLIGSVENSTHMQDAASNGSSEEAQGSASLTAEQRMQTDRVTVTEERQETSVDWWRVWEEPEHFWRVTVLNGSDRPIFNVKVEFEEPFRVKLAVNMTLTELCFMEMAPDLPKKEDRIIESIGPRETVRVHSSYAATAADLGNAAAQVEFVDIEGTRWVIR